MSRVIDKVDGNQCQRWDIPDIVTDSSPAAGHDALPGPRPVSMGRQDELKREAYQEGFELGRKEGLQASRNELNDRVERLDKLMNALSLPFSALDDEIEEKLVTLSMAVARQLVRRELATDPGQIVATVHQAIAALPESGRSVQLHLHPEDAALVRELVPMPEAEKPWKIIEDPRISRGGCEVNTDVSRVDATLEARLNAVIASVLGGAREGDGQ